MVLASQTLFERLKYFTQRLRASPNSFPNSAASVNGFEIPMMLR
jgi:hypothetical protein